MYIIIMYNIYTHIYTYIRTYVCVQVYIYIYILGSSARFARAEAYEIIPWDYIMGLYYGIRLRDKVTGKYYRIILRDITG